jgi:sugar lactone lactonase YvrE
MNSTTQYVAVLRSPQRVLSLTVFLLLTPPVAVAQHVRTLPLSARIGTPDGAAVGADGALYVADYGGGAGTRVLRVDRAGRVTTFADGFAAPDGLAFDAKDDLYVSSFAGGTIHRVTPTGVVSLFASGLDHPSGLAFDRSGTLYVANFGNFNGTTVSRVAPDGSVSTFATGFRTPLGLAFGPDRSLYVSNFASGEIHRVTADGRLERFAQVSNTPLAQLQYLAFDSRGTLYAVSLGHNVVYAIGPDGRARVFAGSAIAGHADGSARDARFHSPNSIAVLSGDTVVVTEFTSGRVRLLAPSAPGAGEQHRPSAARPEGRRLADDSATFVVAQVAPGASRLDTVGTVDVVRRRHGDTLTIVQVWTTESLQSRDTVLLDAGTLRPWSRSAGPPARRTLTQYRSSGLRMTTNTPGGTDSLDVADGEAFEAATVDALAAALPLDERRETVVPLFSAAQRGIVRGEVHARRASGPLGSDGPVWDVDVAYPSAVVTVRISERGRRVLRVEYDYGARRLVLERRSP